MSKKSLRACTRSERIAAWDGTARPNEPADPPGTRAQALPPDHGKGQYGTTTSTSHTAYHGGVCRAGLQDLQAVADFQSLSAPEILGCLKAEEYMPSMFSQNEAAVTSDQAG